MTSMDLYTAIRSDLPSETIQTLIKQSPNLNIQDNVGRTPLHVAVLNASSFEVIYTLIENGANVNIQDILGEIPLHQALIYLSSPEIIHILIEKSDLNIRSRRGYTPLHLAIIQHPETIRTLINQSPNLNIQDNWGRTPLYVAVFEKRRVEIIHALIEGGANVNIQGKEFKGTPLHKAITSQSDPEIIHKLIEFSDLNIGDARKNTPLHLACKQVDQLRIVRALVEKGADWTILNKKFETPYFLATRPNSLSGLLNTFSEEFDRMKKWPLTCGVSLYDVFPRFSSGNSEVDDQSLQDASRKPLWSLTTDSKIIFRDFVADRMLDYLADGYTPFWSLIFRSVVSSRAFTLCLQLGDRRLFELPSRKVLDFLSDVDVGNLLLAYRPELKRMLPPNQSVKRRLQ